jgi:hypothetical protein
MQLEWTQVGSNGRPMASSPKKRPHGGEPISPLSSNPLGNNPTSSPPSPPLLNPSEAEKAWEAWTKEGLTSLCNTHKIHLVSTTKASIIKVLVAAGIKFSAPPGKFQAQPPSKSTTPPQPPKKLTR